jgi:type III pantothenate kinase
MSRHGDDVAGSRSGEWVFDLGNTRLKFAPLHAHGIGAVSAPAHVDAAGGVGALTLPEGAVAHVASVASDAHTLALLELLSQRFSHIQRVRTLPRCAGVRIAYAQPERLGVDRFLALLAAHAAAPRMATLLVAVGTALTIDLLDVEGLHRGGRIAPSPALMREALHARTTHLPAQGGTYTEFAADTEAALASGCEGAALALVERSLAEARRLLGKAPRLLLHGGGAPALQAHLSNAEVEPLLVLQGLAHWARIGRADA